MTLVWRCGWCCKGEGTGTAWMGFLDIRFLGGRGGGRRCSGAAVEVPRACK
jgi:hypothetical protein